MDCGPLMTNFRPPNQLDSTAIASSAAVFGSLSIPSLTIDRQFGMEPGKLRNRAGIRSVSHAAPNETEVSLGMRAAIGAFESAKIAPDVCDWVFASSETHHTFPSLAADLHAGLGLPESCGALDIGGACLGLLHALATAQAFIANGRARPQASRRACVRHLSPFGDSRREAKDYRPASQPPPKSRPGPSDARKIGGFSRLSSLRAATSNSWSAAPQVEEPRLP